MYLLVFKNYLVLRDLAGYDPNEKPSIDVLPWLEEVGYVSLERYVDDMIESTETFRQTHRRQPDTKKDRQTHIHTDTRYTFMHHPFPHGLTPAVDLPVPAAQGAQRIHVDHA
jgi:hypothetical protein